MAHTHPKLSAVAENRPESSYGKPVPAHDDGPDEKMRFVPSGGGYCRHCNHYLGERDRRNFKSGIRLVTGEFICTNILVRPTIFRCPECFTRNRFVPDFPGPDFFSA